MPKLAIDIETVRTPAGRAVNVARLSGIVSAPTLGRFQQEMHAPVEESLDLVLDLSKLTYINSSGLGELVRFHDHLSGRGKAVCLVGMSEDIRQLIAMLGLLNVLREFPDVEAACAALDAGLPAGAAAPETEAEAEAPASGPDRRGEALVPVQARSKPRLPEAHVLLAMDPDSPFTHFMARSLVGDSGTVSIVRDHRGAKAALAEKGPVDIAILERSLPEHAILCGELKTSDKNGLVSLIAIQPDNAPAPTRGKLHVREDEVLEEPFEVRELVALASNEYARCKAEGVLFVKELHMEFPTTAAEIQEANDLVERLVAVSGLPEGEDTSFFYAVREAIDNARRHGNKGDTEKNIEVMYVLDKEKITVTVGDEGPGFDFNGFIRRARSTSPLEQARQRHQQGGYGGLGIGLMLRCCNSVEYLQPGNLLKLTKYV